MGDRKVDRATVIVLLLGPFVFGLAGVIGFLRCAKLSAVQFVWSLVATIIAYGIGFVMFLFVCIILFGVIAT